MNINAKYFGEVSYEENEMIHIINGLFGFETYTKISLQNLEDETLSFILMNPFMIYPDYAPELSQEDLKELGASSIEDISFYVISVIREPIDTSTVNLKAPLIVNALNRKAKQIILEQPEYSFRHILNRTNKEGE